MRAIYFYSICICLYINKELIEMFYILRIIYLKAISGFGARNEYHNTVLWALFPRTDEKELSGVIVLSICLWGKLFLRGL